MKQFNTHEPVPVKVNRCVLQKKEKVKFKPLTDEIWLVKNGGGRLTFASGKEFRVDNGEILFFPQGISYTFTSGWDTQIYCFKYMSLLTTFRGIWPEGMEEMSPVIRDIPYLLRMDSSLKEYIRHLETLFNQRIFTDEWMNLQGHYLLMLLKNSYSPAELTAFFFPILQQRNHFQELVLQYAAGVKNIRELAECCNLSVRTLERRFKETFGVPPGEWLLRRRIEKVHDKIKNSDHPFSLVADQCGFSTTSQLSDFCRKYLGVSPTKLRKGSTT